MESSFEAKPYLTSSELVLYSALALKTANNKARKLRSMLIGEEIGEVDILALKANSNSDNCCLKMTLRLLGENGKSERIWSEKSPSRNEKVQSDGKIKTFY